MTKATVDINMDETLGILCLHIEVGEIISNMQTHDSRRSLMGSRGDCVGASNPGLESWQSFGLL